jgi:hypothetical protein
MQSYCAEKRKKTNDCSLFATKSKKKKIKTKHFFLYGEVHYENLTNRLEIILTYPLFPLLNLLFVFLFDKYRKTKDHTDISTTFSLKLKSILSVDNFKLSVNNSE